MRISATWTSLEASSRRSMKRTAFFLPPRMTKEMTPLVPSGRYFRSQIVAAVPRQSRVGDGFNLVRLAQEGRHFHGIGAVLFHAHRQGFQPQVEEEGGVGRRVASGVHMSCIRALMM